MAGGRHHAHDLFCKAPSISMRFRCHRKVANANTHTHTHQHRCQLHQQTFNKIKLSTNRISIEQHSAKPDFQTRTCTHSDFRKFKPSTIQNCSNQNVQNANFHQHKCSKKRNAKIQTVKNRAFNHKLSRFKLPQITNPRIHNFNNVKISKVRNGQETKLANIQTFKTSNFRN